MSLRLQTALLIAASLIAAVWAGIALAGENYAIPGILAAISCLGLVAWMRVRYEAMLLGFALFGYIVGNRGFAQFMLVPNIPLLVAELTLGACMVALLFSTAITKDTPIRKDALNFFIGLWLLAGGVRLVFDVRIHGFIALRDSAMCYYALFFFVGQSMAQEPRARAILNIALTASLAVLPLTFLAWTLYPDIVMGAMMVRGVPLILYKADIAATLMAAGVFYFFHWAERGYRVAWLGVAASFFGALLPLTRAALLGLVVALGWQAIARRWRLFGLIAALAVTGVAGEVVSAFFRNVPMTRTRTFQIAQYAMTIVPFIDASAIYTESGDVKGNPVDNNFFRLVWWQTIVNETWRHEALFGLGFGHDLASQFLVEYGLMGDTEFTARSPHSILVSAFGRLGVTGAGILVAICIVMAMRTARAMRRWRTDPAYSETAELWAMSWIILISACFGVVLEGPMGAVVFWTLLGLANGSVVPQAAPEPVPELPTRNARGSESMAQPATT
jgi:hypothetical protein